MFVVLVVVAVFIIVLDDAYVAAVVSGASCNHLSGEGLLVTIRPAQPSL